MKKYWLIFLFIGSLLACEGPTPRYPKERKTGSFIKASVERNKALLAKEEKRILDIIKKDSLRTYYSSASGSWYYYHQKNEASNVYPEPDDLVTIAYNVVSLANDTIYSGEEIGIVTYKVDKEELFPGLRNSVKLLKEKETATFLFPSSLAHGYHGDNNKIGVNVPIKSTLTILKIEKKQDNIQN